MAQSGATSRGGGPAGGGAVGSLAGTDSGGGAPGGASAGAGGAGGSQTLSDLPSELNDSPLTGPVSVVLANWEVNGKKDEPAFLVTTPSAVYYVVLKLGMVVSLTNNSSGQRPDWISYSDGSQPHRGLPNLGSCCEADATTTLTTVQGQTSEGHVRLNSSSSDNAWALVWDFYRTHATLTVNHAPQTFSFGYRGSPGGALETARFVIPDGTPTGHSYPASSSVLDQAFSGAAQWAYLANDGQQNSLFLVQHSADDLKDHYGVETEDSTPSSVLSFGTAGGISAPLRFSFGLVESTEYAAVAARINYVINATH